LVEQKDKKRCEDFLNQAIAIQKITNTFAVPIVECSYGEVVLKQSAILYF
jgi:hypothetical protein